MRVRRLKHRYMGNLEPFLRERRMLDSTGIAELLAGLDGPGLPLGEFLHPGGAEGGLARTGAALSQNGFLEFVTEESDALTLTPCSRDFVFGPIEPLTEGTWRLSRFTYSHLDGDEIVVRTPNADCFVTVRGDEILALVHAFRRPTPAASVARRLETPSHAAGICGALARAGVILRCDPDGTTIDETDPARRQWFFHDLVFHSLSRLGRTEKEIGGTYRFRGEIPPPPAVKTHNWTQRVVPLPRADLQALMRCDMPLAAAMESLIPHARAIRALVIAMVEATFEALAMTSTCDRDRSPARDGATRRGAVRMAAITGGTNGKRPVTEPADFLAKGDVLHVGAAAHSDWTRGRTRDTKNSDPSRSVGASRRSPRVWRG